MEGTARSRCRARSRLVAVVGLLIGGLCLLSPAGASRATASITGTFTVVSVNPFATAPAVPTLTVQRGDETSHVITVRVPPGAAVVRRFNGASSLSEVSPGDQVVVTGTSKGAYTIVAARARDTSIQVGGTQINGTVSYIARDFGRMAVSVTANEGENAAFKVGATVLVVINPSLPVLYINAPGAGTNGVQGLRPGLPITFYGFSDRAGQVILSPHDIEQILTDQEDALIRAAPSDGSPK